MKKILIIYNYILHYRQPLFNELCKYYEVTVLHSGEITVGENDKYKEILRPVKSMGPFFLQDAVIKEAKNTEYDVIIALFDVRWINTVLSIYAHNKNVKFIWWGAWITDSPVANFTREYLTKKADANIFYTHEARRDFIERGVDPSNLYVANNTFDVGERMKSYEYSSKNRIIFVGSLDERKQNDITIKAFKNIIDKIPKNIKFTIIGDGKQRKNLENLVNELDMKSRISFEGKITDPEKLKEYYEEAIVSVSFGQAGLSVLQALGFGVPFLTKENAISGGEKSNIKHDLNSIFCEDSQGSLENHLVKLCNDIDFARELGKNAYEYYSEYCTIENMAQGFIDAIENTRLAHIDTSNSLGEEQE